MNVAQGIDHHFGRQTEKYEILFLSGAIPKNKA
jgi:hypothetical protein